MELTSGKPQFHVLVVEDDPLVRDLLAGNLQSAGFAVSEAETGDEALRLFLTHQQYDLVFTDVQMPGSIDGLGLAQAVHDRNPALPVIVTSGALGRGSVPGPFHFIAKPYRWAAAKDMVFSALGLRPQEA